MTYDFPFPTNTGGKNRAYHMLKYAKGDFKKYLFSFIRSDFSTSNFEDLEKIGVEVVGTELRRKTSDLRNVGGVVSGKSIFKSLYYSKKVADELLKIVHERKIDIIHFESFYTAFYLSNIFKTLGVKQIYGSENIEYKLYEEFAQNKGILKPLLNLQVKQIKKEECQMYKNSDANLAVTGEEVEFIKKYNDKTFQIPNGIDIDNFAYHEPVERNEKNILFVGNFSYFPNVSAIEDFHKNIFSKIENDVKLTVIGKKVGSLSFVSDPRVRAVEFVEDIKDAYAAADILISPVKIGGGTNFKILEAMAAGVPVVAYKGRMDAVGVEDEKHVLVASDDFDFQKKIEMLLENLDKRKALANSARKFVEEKYDWKSIGEELGKVWNEI